MHKFINIKNKIYYINYVINIDEIYISLFGINTKYRGRGFSRRIINNIQKKYNKPIELECWFTLYEYYTKLGFKKIGENDNGYFIMRR